MRQLAERLLVRDGRFAILECGCRATVERFTPCFWHLREFAEDLRSLTEDEVHCDEGCCDPA